MLGNKDIHDEAMMAGVCCVILSVEVDRGRQAFTIGVGGEAIGNFVNVCI